jgi:hypothetical protein
MFFYNRLFPLFLIKYSFLFIIKKEVNMTKTKSFERASFALVFSGIMLFLFQVPVAQLLFWSIYAAVSVFAFNYAIKAKKEKASSFCLYSFYFLSFVFLFGAVAFRWSWQLSWSIMIASFLSIFANLIVYSILMAPEISDEESLV